MKTKYLTLLFLIGTSLAGETPLEKCKAESKACTAEICHTNPDTPHCTKKWCKEKENKDKYGCAAPTAAQACAWDKTKCTYEIC